MTTLQLVGPLILVAVVVRLLGGSGREEPLSLRVDGLLTIAAGAGTLALWTFLGTRSPDAPWASGADFNQYCAIVDTMRGGGPDGWTGVQRSAFAGLLPGAIARYRGIAGGLFGSSAVAAVGIGAGLHLWGRALHSRAAGLAAALLTGVFLNLVTLRVSFDFYPLLISVFCLSGGLALVAVRSPSLPTAFGAGLGVALALLIDVRGLLWAAPALLASIVGLAAGPWRAWPARIVLLGLPIVASWPLGRFAYRSNALALDHEIALYLTDALRAAPVANALAASQGGTPLRTPTTSFLWGWGPLDELLPMLIRAFKFSRVASSIATPHGMPPTLAAWVWPVGVCAMVVLGALVRTPRRLAAFVIVAAPFTLALGSALRSGMGGRHIDVGFLIVPVVLGVGWATLACRASTATPKRPLLGLGVVVAGLLVATDVIDTPLAAYASVKWQISSARDVTEMIEHVHEGVPAGASNWECERALKQDLSRGLLPTLPVRQVPDGASEEPSTKSIPPQR